MPFKFLQLLVRWAYRFYYRTIHYVGQSNLPDNEPVIVAANHSNSAVDAIFLSAILSREIHWLARGDVFKNKVIAWLMTYFHTAPIYRSSEFGVESIKRNFESFEHCFRLLRQNKMVGMFPEGVTVHSRQMQRPFKKGMARLAFQAHEQVGRPIHIMPVGVSYRHLSMPRTQVFIKYGQTFSTEKFYETYKQNEVKGLREFTEYFEGELFKQIINYDLVQNQTLLNSLIEINENEIFGLSNTPFGIVYQDQLLHSELALVNNLINWQSSQPERIHKLEAAVSKYISQLAQEGLVDEYVKSGVTDALAPIKTTLSTLLKYFAKIVYFIPDAFVKNFIKRKVKKIEFYTSVRFLLSFLVFWAYSMLLALLIKLGLGFSYWMSLAAILFITYAGLRALNYLHLPKARAQSKHLEQLRAYRKDILDLLT